MQTQTFLEINTKHKNTHTLTHTFEDKKKLKIKFLIWKNFKTMTKKLKEQKLKKKKSGENKTEEMT